jgi:hypothetical protein
LVEKFRLGFLAVIDHKDFVRPNRLGGVDLFVRRTTPDDLGIGGVGVVGDNLARATPTERHHDVAEKGSTHSLVRY